MRRRPQGVYAHWPARIACAVTCTCTARSTGLYKERGHRTSTGSSVPRPPHHRCTVCVRTVPSIEEGRFWKPGFAVVVGPGRESQVSEGSPREEEEALGARGSPGGRKTRSTNLRRLDEASQPRQCGRRCAAPLLLRLRRRTTSLPPAVTTRHSPLPASCLRSFGGSGGRV